MRLVMQTHGNIRIFSTAQISMANILAICILHKMALSFLHNQIGEVQNYGKDFTCAASRSADNITMTEPNVFL